MIEVVLSILIVVVTITNIFLIVLYKNGQKSYDLRVQDLQKQTNMLSSQLVKLALSKNVVEYAQAETISSLADPVTNDMDTEHMQVDTMSDREFDKFLKNQLNPEEETEE